jgi:riboflavin transporter FmnP
MSQKLNRTRRMAGVAMLGAIGFILMFFDFSIPIMPSFIKMDFSELPALVASFAYGPLSGAAVCLIKNVLHLTVGRTGGVGELSNFLLGCFYVVPAGLIYARMRSRKGAALGSLTGCAVSAAVSLPLNYFLIYPLYKKLLPIEAILNMYRAIDPSCDGLFDALLRFNVPFTFVKELIVCAITFLIYKKLSPILRGRK